jgi:hypothetical protein
MWCSTDFHVGSIEHRLDAVGNEMSQMLSFEPGTTSNTASANHNPPIRTVIPHCTLDAVRPTSNISALYKALHNRIPESPPPQTKYYSGQRQSPLFRLPREIRDTIYDYLCDAEYLYDAEPGNMLEDGQVVRLGLVITCRIGAEEMSNVMLRKIRFRARSEFWDRPEYLGLQSRAARFRCSKYFSPHE